ncbi:MAG: flavin reductase family protein [Tepidisphaeraceae bacterium]
MSDVHFYEVAKGHGLPHDPFKAIVAPRPIGWISTVSSAGKPNLAPYSFFNACCDTPPMVMFASVGRKDSLRNIEETGEFVCNLATRGLAEVLNQTSLPLPHGQSEFAAVGLTTAACRLVKPPRVAEAAAALECRAVKTFQLPTLSGTPANTFMTIGQVVAVHIDTAFLKDGLFDMIAAGTIARCGYRGDYAHVTELFEMLRPKP